MKRSLCAAAIVSAAASQAMAQDAKPSFRINQSLYVHSSDEVETKPSGMPSNTVKTTTGTMAPSDMEVVVGFHDILLHFSPVSGGWVALGWAGVKNLEAGLHLGDSRRTVDKPKSSENETTIGLYGIYTVPVGKQLIELGLNLSSTTGATEQTDMTTGLKSKTETSGMSYGVDVAYVHPIVGGVSYTAKLAYAASNSEEKKAKRKTNTSTFAITPVGLRYDF